MLTEEKILERKKEMSTQVSAQTRAYGLAMIVFAWALLTADKDPLRAMASVGGHRCTLLLAAIGFLVLACDLLQYILGYIVADRAAKVAEKAATNEAKYDEKSKVYKAELHAYNAKVRLLLFGTGILLIIFVRMFLD